MLSAVRSNCDSLTNIPALLPVRPYGTQGFFSGSGREYHPLGRRPQMRSSGGPDVWDPEGYCGSIFELMGGVDQRQLGRGSAGAALWDFD
jgi:hypothetical protein